VIRVAKIGGRLCSDGAVSAVAAAMTQAWLSAPGTLVIVHGGGDEMSALQRTFGIEPEFVDGRRKTLAGDIPLLRMALSGAANKRLVSALVAVGAPAVGISGEDAAVLQAQVADEARLGKVGTITTVVPELVRHLLGGGFLPVISPIAADTERASGAALNVNGDDAAVALAVALDAHELMFVSDVPGVLVGGRVVTSIDAAAGSTLVATGDVSGGMQVKLEAAVRAISGGVPGVRIGSLDAVIDRHAGTLVRPAAVAA
jgi:acetylglutamate kinase